MTFDQLTIPQGDLILRLLTVSMALCLSSAFCGCGSETGATLNRAGVAGTVTLDGVPLKAGVIRFVPQDGTAGPKTTASIADGAFSLPDELGPVIGNHRIEIESTDFGGLAMDDEEAIQRLNAQGTPVQFHIVTIPAFYNQVSRLTAHVPEEGTGALRFDLVSQSNDG